MNWMWPLLVMSTIAGGMLTLSALAVWSDLLRVFPIEERAAE